MTTPWARPRPETAQKIWDHLAPSLDFSLDDLVLKYPYAGRDEREVETKRALVVVLDAAVTAGKLRQNLTRNLIFDALARCWSGTFRQAVEAGRGTRVRDLQRATVEGCRRDLHKSGIAFNKVWAHVVRWSEGGRNPLFGLHALKFGGKRIKLKSTREEFERLVLDDPEYRSRGPHVVLFDDDELPPRKERQRVCAERAYNVAEIGPDSHEVLTLLEEVRLQVDVAAVRADYDAAKHKVERTRQHLWNTYRVDPEERGQVTVWIEKQGLRCFGTMCAALGGNIPGFG